jgi:hypothetical protein
MNQTTQAGPVIPEDILSPYGNLRFVEIIAKVGEPIGGGKGGIASESPKNDEVTRA